MPNKTINARVKQKRDTHTNWQSKNPVILNGEIILVDIDGGLRAKVGNGTKKYSELPFSDEALRSLIDAKVPTSRTINGKALTSNISLSASDIGADASGSASTALTNANKYTDEEISTLSQDVAGSIGSLQTELTAAINSKQPAGDYATKAEAQGYANAKDSAITAAKNAGTTAQTNLNNHTKDKSNPHGVTASQVGAVPTTRTINNKALSTNISLTASDVGADVSGSSSSALDSAKSYTDSQIDEWVGDTKVSVQISEAIKNHSDSDHNHKYAGSDSVGGAATSANKVNKSLTVNGSGLGADAGVTFDGSNEITISYNTIGAAASSHGNHVPEAETANNAKFLRNDNSWAIVTPENIGAAKSSHGTHVEFSEVAPKAAGTAAVGTAATVSRSDHVHPAQTSITGNAATATKATQDASGNVITSTYATKAELKEVGDLVGDTAVSTQISTAVGKITHPVTSVNSKTGAVSLTYSDVDAAPSSHTHTKLSNKYTSRPTTANIASSDDRKGTVEFFHCTSSMTTGAPPFEGHILHMNWDNAGGWDSQLCVKNSSAGLAVRGSSNGTWGDWATMATQDYVREQIASIGSSTASGMVCEFDSGAINLTSSSSPFTSRKDSKSKWYWIWAYNSTLGGYMGFHVDWKALKTSGEPIFCGSDTTKHFGITVSKNSSNKLVVSVPNSATTVKRVVGYY